MTKERGFKVAFTSDENSTAFGIIEQNGDEIVYIASIYREGKLSRTQMFNFWNQHITKRLEVDERALIMTNDISARSNRRLKWPRHSVKFIRRGPMLNDTRALAIDAMIRKSNITEELT